MTTASASRRGFTLVELLIVMVVIVLLVAVTVPAVMSAIGKAKVFQITSELTQLESAIEEYKSENGGDYPPDFTGYPEPASPPFAANFELQLTAHIQKCFPRCSQNLTLWKDLNVGTANPFKPSTLDPAEALVFWLTMIRNNPQWPLPWLDGSAQDNTTAPTKIYFEFKPERLKDIDQDGWPEYYPMNSPDAPFVYFNARTYTANALGRDYGYPRQNLVAPYVQPSNPGQFGRARPYAKQVDPMNAANVLQWVGTAKFQIISGGLDRYFGDDTSNAGNALLVLAKIFPTGDNYTPRVEEDNLTNFSQGRTLGGNRP